MNGNFKDEKVAQIQAHVEEVKKVLLNDLDLLLERQWRLEETIEKAERLKQECNGFKVGARKVKEKERKRNWFWTSTLVGSGMVNVSFCISRNRF